MYVQRECAAFAGMTKAQIAGEDQPLEWTRIYGNVYAAADGAACCVDGAAVLLTEPSCGVVVGQRTALTARASCAFLPTPEEFVSLFDSQINAFLVGEGSSTEDFFSLCHQSIEGGQDDDAAGFSSMLLTLTDYDAFLMMMREEAKRSDERKPEAKAEAKDSSEAKDDGGAKDTPASSRAEAK